MNKRGPPPLSDVMLRIRRSKQRRKYEHEDGGPEATASNDLRKGGGPAAPKWLSKSEAALWAEITPVLQELGIVSSADAIALGRYCHVLAEWIEVTQEIRSQPRTVQGNKAK